MTRSSLLASSSAESARRAIRLGRQVRSPANVKGVPRYGYKYVPAPPDDVTSVTFDGGAFGHFPGIPIED